MTSCDGEIGIAAGVAHRQHARKAAVGEAQPAQRPLAVGAVRTGERQQRATPALGVERIAGADGRDSRPGPFRERAGLHRRRRFGWVELRRWRGGGGSTRRGATGASAAAPARAAAG